MSDATWDGTRPAPTVPPERAILTDLIAEMRDHYKNCTDCGFMQVAADEAEARLFDDDE